MPRQPRIHYPGATYHVILRGNNKQEIFTNDRERIKFQALIEEGVTRFGHQIITFCLMSNHVHLVIRIGEIPLAEVIQNLSFRYCRSYNFRHQRTGHLFEGRYKAILVVGECYLRRLIRYVHMNPVKAGMVADPMQYRWSGHRAYLGEEVKPWLAVQAGLAAFTGLSEDPREYYRVFVRREIDPEEWMEFERCPTAAILGNSDVVCELQRQAATQVGRKTVSLESLVDDLCGFYGIDPEALRRSDQRSCTWRSIAALVVRRTRGVSIRQLANYLGVADATLSKAATRLEGRMRESASLKSEVERFVGMLKDAVNI